MIRRKVVVFSTQSLLNSELHYHWHSSFYPMVKNGKVIFSEDTDPEVAWFDPDDFVEHLKLIISVGARERWGTVWL